jgi:hypothetical protein
VNLRLIGRMRALSLTGQHRPASESMGERARPGPAEPDRCAP